MPYVVLDANDYHDKMIYLIEKANNRSCVNGEAKAIAE